jgi:hypothetical protein
LNKRRDVSACSAPVGNAGVGCDDDIDTAGPCKSVTPPPAIVLLYKLTNQPICAESPPYIFARGLSEAKNHTGPQKLYGVVVKWPTRIRHCTHVIALNVTLTTGASKHQIACRNNPRAQAKMLQQM